MKRSSILLVPLLLHSLTAFYIDEDNRTVTTLGEDIRTSDSSQTEVLECGDSTELAEGGQVGISSPVSRYQYYLHYLGGDLQPRPPRQVSQQRLLQLGGECGGGVQSGHQLPAPRHQEGGHPHPPHTYRGAAVHGDQVNLPDIRYWILMDLTYR